MAYAPDRSKPVIVQQRDVLEVLADLDCPPDRSKPVSVQIRDVLECLAGMKRATGTIVFTGKPAAADTVTVYGVVHEFLTMVADLSDPEYVPVLIGATTTTARDNLLAALAHLPRVNPDIPLAAVAAYLDDGNPAIALVYWELGVVGNDEMVVDSAVIVPTGMADGEDGGPVVGGLAALVEDTAPVLGGSLTLGPYSLIIRDGVDSTLIRNPEGNVFFDWNASNNVWILAGGALSVSALRDADGNQVVGPQGDAVADATDTPDVVEVVNAILARLRAHGLIATSA